MVKGMVNTDLCLFFIAASQRQNAGRGSVGDMTQSGMFLTESRPFLFNWFSMGIFNKIFGSSAPVSEETKKNKRRSGSSIC